jgi:hypothetical protein
MPRRLGEEFMMAVDAHLARLATPAAPAYLGTVRRQVMHGFPYGIFYEPHRRASSSSPLDLRQDQNAFAKSSAMKTNAPCGSSCCVARLQLRKKITSRMLS